MKPTLRSIVHLGLALALAPMVGLAGQPSPAPTLLRGNADAPPVALGTVAPLTGLTVLAPAGTSVEVRDGAGRTYVQACSTGHVGFLAGGALGEQQVLLRDASGAETGCLKFVLEAETSIDDGGRYRDMFALFRQGMSVDFPAGVGRVDWNKKTYHFFESWGLDHYHTMKGMKYFSPVGAEFVDMMREAQREDGMIWSRVLDDNRDAAYYKTCYGPFGYVRLYGDLGGGDYGTNAQRLIVVGRKPKARKGKSAVGS